MERLGSICIRLIEVLFFTGLAGCSIVVVLSWLSIFKSEFFDKEDMKTDAIPVVTQQPTAYRFIQSDLGASRTITGGVDSPAGRSRG
ncbi:hypothetical protein DYQ86_11675 [Acidobacteria bacterium AB60]|nr:hypothetical protein DYQ86_11675 [Acidobacteria bacterium AB60]